MNAGPVLFDTTLRPNPPMGAGTLKGIVAVVAAFNFAFGLVFILRGAWPVTPFMGADVLLLAWALGASRRAAQCCERLLLTPSRFLLARQAGAGARTEVEFNPYWLRVDLDQSLPSAARLMLRSHGRAEQIGSFLRPEERLSVARRLRAALQQARESRYV